MKISILTLFSEMFEGPLTLSIVKRAQEKGLVEIEYIDIRDFGTGSHQMVDDTEFGGGIGMLLKVDVVHAAIQHAINNFPSPSMGEGQGEGESVKRHIILMAAAGETYKQATAREYSQLDHLIIICGHYEGIDHRISKYIDAEVSIGDFVLTGGEIPAMLIVDSITRLITGVLPEGATEDESFSTHGEEQLLEYPHYTKPRSYDGQDVPEVLLSGDHGKIKEWRLEKSRERTKKERPDLLIKK